MAIDRSKYTDNTRAIRAGRREALLNIAATRMGADTWSKLESSFRYAVETAKTEKQMQSNLFLVLDSAMTNLALLANDTEAFPQDVAAALEAYPSRKAGRPINKKSGKI